MDDCLKLFKLKHVITPLSVPIMKLRNPKVKDVIGFSSVIISSKPSLIEVDVSFHIFLRLSEKILFPDATYKLSKDGSSSNLIINCEK